MSTVDKLAVKGLGIAEPASFGDSRLGVINDWINKGTSVGKRQQRSEMLEHFMGGPRKGGKLIDRLLVESPKDMRAALARIATRRKTPSPFRNEAMAHFYGGFKADRDAGLMGSLGNGIGDMRYAMESSPLVKKDFGRAMRNTLLAGGGLFALKKMLDGRREAANEVSPFAAHQMAPQGVPMGPPQDKVAALSMVETEQLVRKLKRARGMHGGARMLRLLEARLKVDTKQKRVAASKKKSKKKSRR